MSGQRGRKPWKSIAPAALTAVVAFASPAAAAEQSTTTVQATPSTASVGESVQLTATVACAADATGGLGVTFFDGDTLLGTVPVGADGKAGYITMFTAPGTHTITGAYNGNQNCGASNSTTAVQVSPAPVPPSPPGSGTCLLLCGGSLINFSVGDIHNHIGG